MKILLVSGSLRKRSMNTQMMKLAQSFLETHDHVEIQILDWSNVPMFNQDLEFPVLKSVQDCRNAFQWADGVWFFCPEYNGMIPGPLKNMLDWMSRPLDPSAGRTSALSDHHAAICGVAGRSGAINSCQQLETLLKRLGVDVLDEHVFKSFTGAQLAQSVFEADEQLQTDLSVLASHFISFILQSQE